MIATNIISLLIAIILVLRDNNEKFLDAVGIVTGWGRLEYGGCHLHHENNHQNNHGHKRFHMCE